MLGKFMFVIFMAFACCLINFEMKSYYEREREIVDGKLIAL